MQTSLFHLSSTALLFLVINVGYTLSEMESSGPSLKQNDE